MLGHVAEVHLDVDALVDDAALLLEHQQRLVVLPGVEPDFFAVHGSASFPHQ